MAKKIKDPESKYSELSLLEELLTKRLTELNLIYRRLEDEIHNTNCNQILIELEIQKVEKMQSRIRAEMDQLNHAELKK